MTASRFAAMQPVHERRDSLLPACPRCSLDEAISYSPSSSQCCELEASMQACLGQPAAHYGYLLLGIQGSGLNFDCMGHVDA